MLRLSPELPTMNLQSGSTGIRRVRKGRTDEKLENRAPGAFPIRRPLLAKVKIEKGEESEEKKLEINEPSTVGWRRRKVKLVKVKIEKGEEHVIVPGLVKREPQEEAAITSAASQRYSDIADILKREPREETGPRSRRKSLPKARVEENEAKDSRGNDFHETAKRASAEFVSRRKRKVLGAVAAGATPSDQASGRKRASQVSNGPAFGLEIVEVRASRGVAQLASERASNVISVKPGPYPTYARPFPAECQEARDLLSALHRHLPEYKLHRLSCPTPLQYLDPAMSEMLKLEGTENGGNTQLGLRPTASSGEGRSRKDMVNRGHPRNRSGVLDSLIGTLLSQNTTSLNSSRAFGSLKSKFPTWEDAFRADQKDVEDAIRCGGLAEIKAERIRNVLGTLLKERGEISLEYIRNLSNEDIKVELSRFKGVGPKTVACVLMFHLHRNEFPVDTHVFRISKMLGWIPQQADREKAYLHLNQRIPDSLKYEIHCLFVTHGKRCPKCAKRMNQQPSDGDCPLLNWNSKWSAENQALLQLEHV